MHKEKGTLALFDDPESLLEATEKVRKLNIEYMETYTPFPVHGMEQAMGLKRSWIPWATLAFGLSGAGLAFGFQAWTSAVNWPINVGGKPFISWPAFIPVSFEGMVLISGLLTTLVGLVIVYSTYGMIDEPNPDARPEAPADPDSLTGGPRPG